MESANAPGAGTPPGKRRTWWHPLLVRLLEWLLRDSCDVRDEVSVGRMPLRLDILLIRRLGTTIPAAALRDLAAICRRLNTYTLIEFKSPVDALEYGDWNKLLGCAHLFVAQSEDTVRSSELTLLILAPVCTAGFERELSNSGRRVVEEEPGIHRIDGGAFPAYLVETDRVAGRGEPMLTLFSHEAVERPRWIVEMLGAEHAGMLDYVMQQIGQFRESSPQFEVQHMTEKMITTLKELQELVLERATVEERLRGIPVEERLQGIPAAERLQGIPAAERLQGIPAAEVLKRFTAEEVLRNMSEDERARLRKLVNEQMPKETGSK